MNTELLRRQNLNLNEPSARTRRSSEFRSRSLLHSRASKDCEALRVSRGRLTNHLEATSKERTSKASLMNPFTVATAREHRWELGMLTLVAAIALVAIFSGFFERESWVRMLVDLVQALRG